MLSQQLGFHYYLILSTDEQERRMKGYSPETGYEIIRDTDKDDVLYEKFQTGYHPNASLKHKVEHSTTARVPFNPLEQTNAIFMLFRPQVRLT